MSSNRARETQDSHTLQTTAYVTRHFVNRNAPVASEPETKNELLEIHTFATEPAKVNVAMGLTLNLGNYESARIDVGIAVPCYREEADEAYKEAFDWVNKRVAKEVADMRQKRSELF